MVSTALETRIAKFLESQGNTVSVSDSVEENAGDADLIISDRLSINEILRLRAVSNGKICLADPKIKLDEELRAARLCDFVMVGSFEHKKAMSALGITSVQFTFLPILESKTEGSHKKVDKGAPLVLGYHGNKVHLDTFAKRTLKTIDRSLDTKVVLRAFYNMKRLGKWDPGRLSNIEVQHIPWHPIDTFAELELVDVGVVPNSIPHHASPYTLMPRRLSNPLWKINPFGIRKDDYDLRFKVTSNAGRIYPFGKASVPVIADFFPSSSLLIRDGLDGFLCLSDNDWATAVNTFVQSPCLAKDMGASLLRRVSHEFDSAEAREAIVQSIYSQLKK